MCVNQDTWPKQVTNEWQVLLFLPELQEFSNFKEEEYNKNISGGDNITIMLFFADVEMLQSACKTSLNYFSKSVVVDNIGD